MNTLDPTTWKGFLAEKTGGLDEKAVKDIQKKIKNGETIPSIVVMQWYGAEVLYDGHHRFEAHKREKKLCPYEYIYEGEFVEHLPKSYKGQRPFRPEQPKSQRVHPVSPWRIRRKKLEEERAARAKRLGREKKEKVLKKEQENGN